jgi:hypothetical protein
VRKRVQRNGEGRGSARSNLHTVSLLDLPFRLVGARVSDDPDIPHFAAVVVFEELVQVLLIGSQMETID